MLCFAIKYLTALPLGLNDDSNRIVKLKAERCEAAADEMRSVLLVPIITCAAALRTGRTVFRDLLQQASLSLGSYSRVRVLNIQRPSKADVACQTDLSSECLFVARGPQERHKIINQ